jgi:leucyl/phenylalanyl-tRNA---protein transferase
VALGGVFFGESMFSRAKDASKVALAHLVARLRRGGFVLLDIQFVTAHLSQFGAVALPRARYRRGLERALAQSPIWHGEAMTGAEIVALLPEEAAEIRAVARG